MPRFSPDGKQIAFIGGMMTDQGSTGGDIYLIPATGLQPATSPKTSPRTRPSSPPTSPGSTTKTIGISEHLGGSTHITALDLTTGKDVPSIDLTLPETIIAGTDVMSVSDSTHSTTSP